MKRSPNRAASRCGDPCVEDVDCRKRSGSLAGLDQSTLLAHQAIDLIGGLVGLIAKPLAGGQPAECCPDEPRHCCGAGRFSTTTDIKLEARAGEQRVITLLVENNRPSEATVAFKPGPWLDAQGRAVAIPVEFSPASVTLKAGEAVSIKALVKVMAPAEAGMTYFTEFIMEGCSYRPITVGLRVQAEGCHDVFVQCDECRPARGRFVEYCHGSHNCHEHHDHCGCDNCCRDADPHQHWINPCGCARYYRAA
jgi:hypothetical protein